MAFKEYPKYITTPDNKRIIVNSRKEEDKVLGVKPVETVTETSVPTTETKTKGKKGWN